MALLQCQFQSPVLDKQVAMHVLLPECGDGPFPVLYLLHGLKDDATAWVRKSNLERHVASLPLIVAMPDGYRGFYTDHEEGPAFGRYMLEDVVGFVERSFHAKKERGGRCIGGLSMGGYGALRLALARPDLFVSAHSHSGALQAGRGVRDFDQQPEFQRVFGRNPQGSAHDLHALIERDLAAGAALPEMWIDCGTEDFLYEHNTAFAAFLRAKKVGHTHREYPGAHTWDYWDARIVEALAFHARALGIGAA